MTVLATQPESAALLWLNRPDVATYGEQLSTLENLSPLFVLNTADQSVAMARQRWPSDPSQVAEASAGRGWWRRVSAWPVPTAAISSSSSACMRCLKNYSNRNVLGAV